MEEVYVCLLLGFIVNYVVVVILDKEKKNKKFISFTGKNSMKMPL